ncbi:MAG: hypothetical protein V1882_00445 [Candidatus Omnitrophota bacterium]
MNPLFVYLSLLFFSPLFIFLTHMVVARSSMALRLKIQPLMTGVFAVVITFAWVASLAWLSFLGRIPAFSGMGVAVLYGILTYTGLAFCYFQVFAMTETARRLRILYELYTRKETTLSQLDADYGASRMLETRLARMVEIGQLGYDGQRYTLRRTLLLRVGQLMSFWAKVLGFKS